MKNALNPVLQNFLDGLVQAGYGLERLCSFGIPRMFEVFGFYLRKGKTCATVLGMFLKRTITQSVFPGRESRTRSLMCATA